MMIMRGIPPEVTTLILAILAITAPILAAVLARRGKREDNRQAERGQAFDEVVQLADARLTEITRLNGELIAARAEVERLRDVWEARWSRQMKRCRDVTDSLSRAVTALRRIAGPAADAEADHVQRVLQEHNEDDHTTA